MINEHDDAINGGTSGEELTDKDLELLSGGITGNVTSTALNCFTGYKCPVGFVCKGNPGTCVSSAIGYA